MKSIKEIWEEIAGKLADVYEPREARGVAKILLQDVFGIVQSDFLLDEGKKINEKELEKYVDRLLTHEPVQYVTGIAHFYGKEFKVEKGVLIPRPETEELVRLIVDQNTLGKPRVLDVGIGSGCIAISLAHELSARVYGIDISEKAVEVALINSRKLGADCEFSLCNVLETTPNIKDLDILVSNPPYVPNRDKLTMDLNVLDFEPEKALFVPDDNPLKFYRRIAEFGTDALKPAGRLYFEIHEAYAEELKFLVEETGYSEVVIYQDMQGKDRMLSAINSTSR